MRPQKAGFDESLLWQVTTGKNLAKGGGERFWSPPLEHNGKHISIEDNQGKYGPDLLCDFQPYWGKTPGQFARTRQFKLYRDGRFFDVPNDLREQHDLFSGETGKAVRDKLQALLETCPPGPRR